MSNTLPATVTMTLTEWEKNVAEPSSFQAMYNCLLFSLDK